MEEGLPCPGCASELPLSATSCQVCLRARSKQEIVRGYKLVREQSARRRRRPLLILAAVAAAAACAWAGLRYRGTLVGLWTAAQTRLGSFMDSTTDPRNLGAPAPAPAPRPAAPLAAAAAVSVPVSAPAPAAPAAAKSEPAAGQAQPAVARASTLAPCPAPSNAASWQDQWTLYGRAYDLLSLKPAANAVLQAAAQEQGALGMAQGPSFSADGSGCYAVVLAGGGARYQIKANGGDFVPTVLYWSDIPYATLPAAERRRMADAARDGDVPAPDLSDANDEKAVRRDLFLVPRR